ncbi:aromatic compound dioxygenase [Fragilariopsis cylindrus CCMP1102]|uniref:Aromatic compound dioxygenase n=1 Tax=Fragilariopsis cylindrus CCMP1102 TaxID=635003 RepID=A0A1E7EJY4_9STRA|nr:aromatic compound dioxygenase [Fragilariopsis cylindrus CCMP1102]|eukprot:OEU05863.1 aromatic compound dioxygenase [Fragilariopsis cylindrus CCMP1102]
MAIPRWNYSLQILLLYFSFYIKHSDCQQQQLEQEGPSNNPHIVLYGSLRNDVGESVPEAQVQFWHADYNGNYYRNPSNNDVDGYELCNDTFSYFGTADTDAMGIFLLKTQRPGLYPSRPITHIHFKIWQNGQELLTSQFYFNDEHASRMFDDMLVLTLQESIQDDNNGNSFFYATKTVVVKNNRNLTGIEKLTPDQQEGPFYPVVDFFDVGNDMTVGLLDRLEGGGDGGVVTADELPILESVLPLSSAPSAGLIFNASINIVLTLIPISLEIFYNR